MALEPLYITGSVCHYIDPGKEMCLDQALQVLLWLYGTQEKRVIPRLDMVDRCNQAFRIFLVYSR
jgi:hypothetical protein